MPKRAIPPELPRANHSPAGVLKHLPFSAQRRRLGLVQWLAPLGMMLIVLLYQLSAAKWLHNQWGSRNHFILEAFFFGLLGPIVIYALIFYFRRWLEEQETCDLLTQLLGQTREQNKISQAASDDALQALFAASLIVTAFHEANPHISNEDKLALSTTKAALDKSIEKLRLNLNAEHF